MQWNKVRCGNYSEFELNVVNEYESMDKDAFVHDHTGEWLYHFNYSPWDVHIHYGSCIAEGFDWDAMRAQYINFSIDSGDGWVSRHWRGTDCNGTPTFTHGTAYWVGQPDHGNIYDYEPVTVGYVLDWLGWFLYQLENSKLTVTK